MADIGLNQQISPDSSAREFHIQTATLVDEGLIRTEVFERGRLLFVENYRYERRNPTQNQGAEGRLRRLVEQFHRSIIEEIDSLFEISERVIQEENPTPNEKLARVFLSMHIFDKAEAHFKRAIEVDPGRHSSYIYLGKCYYLQKRYNQAVETLSQLLNKGVRFPDLYNLMGLIMMDRGNYWQSFHHYKEALKLNPAYIEAYFNLAEAILKRMTSSRADIPEQEVRKSIDFLRIILRKIDNFGNIQDRKQSNMIAKALMQLSVPKALNLIHEYREKQYIRRIPPEIIGYKFYLRLIYGREEMSAEVLENYEQQLSKALEANPSYPDLWHYLALIHLMQCRYFFLKGLENFQDATRINPHFEKALKNLRLVENDGREFMALIKTIV
ncbi:MAG: tetratricopeptide repeat protein [Calditrichaeota bacterium]|nr:MAG: tetratricopeptide repeat protein [Calditrichota bacterium]